MATKTRVTLVFTKELQEALNQLAAERGASISGLVRSICGEYLEKQGRPVDWVLTWGGRRDKPAVTPPDDE